MRVLVFFDLPTETTEDRREYSRFRKRLIKNGYIMLQESVYVKLALNQTYSEKFVEEIKKNKPSKGLVQVLVITEKQYSKMKSFMGVAESDVISTDERLVII